jgi:hypothetical protein
MIRELIAVKARGDIQPVVRVPANADTASREIRTLPRPLDHRSLALASMFCRMRLDHPDDPSGSVWIRLDPSGSVRTDGTSNVSRPDPSGAIPIDAEHPTPIGKLVGSNSISGFTSFQLRLV